MLRVVKKLLDVHLPEIHGMVHRLAGVQTKVLTVVKMYVVKDNLFPVPPLFKTIQEQRHGLAESYKVFNIKYRLEVYPSPNMPKR